MPEPEMKPGKPEMHPPGRTGGTTVQAMTIDQLTNNLSAALDQNVEIEKKLKFIEEAFLSDENLIVYREEPELLLSIYTAMMRRQQGNQAFLTRMLDLGVKTKLMSRLVEGSGPSPIGKKVPKTTRELQDLQAKLRELIDIKHREAQEMSQIEAVEIESEVTPVP